MSAHQLNADQIQLVLIQWALTSVPVTSAT